jgi:hypothetical protein
LTRVAVLFAASLFAGTALAQGTGLPGTSLPGMGVPGAGIPGLGTGDSTNPSNRSEQAPGTSTNNAPSSRLYTGTGLPPLPGSRMAITCPTVHGGRLLVSSDVYNGSPIRGTLMPQHGGKWSLPPHDWPGDAYFISCEYGYDRPPLGIRLPQHVRACERPKDDPMQVSCR